MLIYRYLCFLFFVSSKSESLDELYQYVSKEIAASATLERPINNAKLVATNDSSIKFAGDFDFIIIGGGSAGSLLAGRLSEVCKWNVLLLEAGSNQTAFTDIPFMPSYSYTNDKNWAYFTSPQKSGCQGMINKTCAYPRGKALGGSAAINGVVNARGVPADYDEWETMGNKGWSFKDSLPFFKSFEKVDFANANPYYYGQQGKIHVNYTFPPSAISDVFINGNIQNGLPEIDYNAQGIHGVSKIQFHIKGNKRDNSAHEYVDTAQGRPNFNVSLNSFVTKILVKFNTAYGVEFVRNGQKFYATATKEVILSAGAINSPQILMLSGIGHAWELLLKGILPKVHLPAVGKHLKDHCMFINSYFRTNLTFPINSLRDDLQRYQEELAPFTRGSNLEFLAFLNTKNNTSLRNIELITFGAPFAVPPNPKAAFNLNSDYVKAFQNYNTSTDFNIFVILLKPRSEGSIKLQSNDPIDYPIIDIGFLSDPNNEDVEDLHQAVRYVLSLQQTPAFKRVNATFISTNPPCEYLRSVNITQYWHCAIRHASTTVFHATGTTRMGTSTSDSVVNADLKVHTMKKLRIVDAGVMPSLPGGHTNSPTYMIAEQAAYRIKKEYEIF